LFLAIFQKSYVVIPHWHRPVLLLLPHIATIFFSPSKKMNTMASFVLYVSFHLRSGLRYFSVVRVSFVVLTFSERWFWWSELIHLTSFWWPWRCVIHSALPSLGETTKAVRYIVNLIANTFSSVRFCLLLSLKHDCKIRASDKMITSFFLLLFDAK